METKGLTQILKMYLQYGINFTMETNQTLNNISTCELTVQSCKDLNELKYLVENFNNCELKKYAKNTVFADGNPKAEIMLIGEAPGANEDLQGIPFCGKSGQLLDKMLGAIGLDRSTVYISNTVFWRPPGNRQPTYEETEMCRPFLEKHIALIKPKVIVLVGGVAANSILKSNIGISKIRGKFYEYTNQYLSSPITTTAIFHPAYLLRQPKQKRLAWEDLQLIQKHLKS